MLKFIFNDNKCASLEKFVYQITQKRQRCSLSSIPNSCRYSKDGLVHYRKNYPRLPSGHLIKVHACLKEHNLEFSGMTKGQLYRKFREPLWVLERKILFLEEVGVKKIKFSHLDNIPKALRISVQLFKAQTSIPADINIAKNLLSFVKDSKTEINFKELEYLNDDMNLQTYINECALHFLKKRITGVDENSLIQITKGSRIITSRIKSFRNWKKQLDFLQQDLNLSNEFILKNPWILQIPSEVSRRNIEFVRNNLEELDVKNALRKCPNILMTNSENLRKLIRMLKSYQITIEMINYCPYILNLDSDRFYNRYQNLMRNPYTLVYQHHPKFLLMIQNYKTLTPRVNYLQENDVKFASLDALTADRDVSHVLGVNKRTNGVSLRSFLKKQFKNPSTIVEDLKKHPYCRYVPLARMYETLVYLKTIFSLKIIEKHIYCLLYDKTDIETARLELSETGSIEQNSQKNLLPMCIYKIEKKFGFTGKGVLSGLKFKNQNVANSKEEVVKNVLESFEVKYNCDNVEKDSKSANLSIESKNVSVSDKEKSEQENLNLINKAHATGGIRT